MCVDVGSPIWTRHEYTIEDHLEVERYEDRLADQKDRIEHQEMTVTLSLFFCNVQITGDTIYGHPSLDTRVLILGSTLLSGSMF